MQGARPAPQGLSPRLNLTGAVRVLCEIEKVAIAIQRRFLQQESIPESSLYLGHPSCNVSDHNSTHVILVAAWGECGTVVQSVRPGSDPPWGAGRGLREAGSRSGEGPRVAWGARKTLHPEASDSKCRRTQPRVRIGPSSHRGPGCTLVQGFWWKVRVYKSLPVILMHRRGGEPVGEEKGQESQEPVRERVCLCTRVHVYENMFVCMCIGECACVHVRRRACVCACVHVYKHVSVCMCVGEHVCACGSVFVKNV